MTKRVIPADGTAFDASAEVVIVGAGACGLTAALAAHDAGADVLVLERDQTPSGSTALSSGFIPAAGTRFQAALDIEDTAALFEADIQAKARGMAVPVLAVLASRTCGPALEWLADRHGLEWVVLDDFLYPGHSRYRMHAVPEKTGAALMARLLAAAERATIPIATQAHVSTLFVDGDTVSGVEISRPDGARERIGCGRLILACNGYGGNPDLVREHIPEMQDALYFGHAGNQGDAILWGVELGAELRHLSGYQGHGSVAAPHGILITWALMMEGGYQVNRDGKRFSNEHAGYSEQSLAVLAQPDGVAWNIYDDRLHRLGLGFEDYRTADDAGAVRTADTFESLSIMTGLPADALMQTAADVEAMQAGSAADPFGRDFTTKPKLEPPWCAIKVTGALFHTQGGLMINDHAQVLRADGSVFPNLYGAGGAACGVSGPDVSGYLSGNGLLTAISFGMLAGRHAGNPAGSGLISR